MQIPIYKPELPPYEAVEPDIQDMYASGMLYPGPYTDRLVEQVEEYCGVDFVLPVASCSLGLILLLNTVPKGSKVIMPAFTFNATLQALEWNGLVPVVVDVDDNGLMRHDLVEDYFLSQGIPTYNPDFGHDVGAILPVHMWGNLCDTCYYRDIHHMWDVPVFYDGAHVLGSFGSEPVVQGKQRVIPGQATVFSIAATKPVSAGEGGLIVTSDPELYKTLLDSSSHGLFNSLNTKVRGINGKIQEFNSILAYHALKQFDKTKARRRELMELYRMGLADLPLRIWETREGVDASYKDCVVFTEQRNDLDRFLQSRGVGTKRYFEPAIPDMGSFKGIVHSADNARSLAATCLSLPLYPALTDEEIVYVIRTVREFYHG